MKRFSVVAVLFIFLSAALHSGAAPKDDWNFAVSGDSRNCGDVVVPAIAEGVKRDHAAFYWHLGDLRAIYGIDEDYLHEPERRGQPPNKEQYLKEAWDDFIQSQIAPFGKTPVFVGIGNHELVPPKTREDFVAKFKPWLDAPPLRKQRLADDAADQQPRTYFHWIQKGVDFISLDNATINRYDFDAAQLEWFEGVIGRASKSQEVKAVVLGMHAALPDSVAFGHSMSDFPAGVESGRRVYNDLLKFQQQTGKHVYILASHSHFFISGLYNTDYWQKNGGVLPGYIVGTAGAIRYPCRPGCFAQPKRGKKSMDIYWARCTVTAPSILIFMK